ncbi:MAG: chemotaxis protein CheD [Oligoflexia bacterium]|nr:chemotaxis protein CheD [Oligoflexia bacterium]
MNGGNDNSVIIGISDCVVTNNKDITLVTYSLGSCIGVTFYDPINVIGGMIHCMLPLSSNDPAKAQKSPFMYVDTGIVLMLKSMFEMGAVKKNLICKVAGSGTPLDDNGVFRIGERNYALLRKILWKNDILIKGELIGGRSAKTMFLYMNNGITIVRTDNKIMNEI